MKINLGIIVLDSSDINLFLKKIKGITQSKIINLIILISFFILLLEIILLFCNYLSISFFPDNYKPIFSIEDYNYAKQNETLDFSFSIDKSNKQFHFRTYFFFISKKGSKKLPYPTNFSKDFDVDKERYSEITGKISTKDTEKGKYFLCVLLENKQNEKKIIECDTSPLIIN